MVIKLIGNCWKYCRKTSRSFSY